MNAAPGIAQISVCAIRADVVALDRCGGIVDPNAIGSQAADGIPAPRIADRRC